MIMSVQARRIVRSASALAKNKEVKAWLFEDPMGNWEKMAEALVDSATENHPGTSSAEVEEAVAIELVVSALSAILRRENT